MNELSASAGSEEYGIRDDELTSGLGRNLPTSAFVAQMPCLQRTLCEAYLGGSAQIRKQCLCSHKDAKQRFPALPEAAASAWWGSTPTPVNSPDGTGCGSASLMETPPMRDTV